MKQMLLGILVVMGSAIAIYMWFNWTLVLLAIVVFVWALFRSQTGKK